MANEKEVMEKLISDSVILMVKTSLRFNSQIEIRGVICVTVDQAEVSVIHIDKNLKPDDVIKQESCQEITCTTSPNIEQQYPAKRIKLENGASDNAVADVNAGLMPQTFTDDLDNQSIFQMPCSSNIILSSSSSKLNTPNKNNIDPSKVSINNNISTTKTNTNNFNNLNNTNNVANNTNNKLVLASPIKKSMDVPEIVNQLLQQHGQKRQQQPIFQQQRQNPNMQQPQQNPQQQPQQQNMQQQPQQQNMQQQPQQNMQQQPQQNMQQQPQQNMQQQPQQNMQPQQNIQQHPQQRPQQNMQQQRQPLNLQQTQQMHQQQLMKQQLQQQPNNFQASSPNKQQQQNIAQQMIQQQQGMRMGSPRMMNTPQKQPMRGQMSAPTTPVQRMYPPQQQVYTPQHKQPQQRMNPNNMQLVQQNPVYNNNSMVLATPRGGRGSRGPRGGGVGARGVRGGRGRAKVLNDGWSSVEERGAGGDAFSFGKTTVTQYICNICKGQYKSHSSLLTHQVRTHGRQKKVGMGRKPKNQSTSDFPNPVDMEFYEDGVEEDEEYAYDDDDYGQ